jgi:hypothetical protein
MNLAEQHIYLMFDIQNSLIQKIGEVKILIHKHTDMEKWKNPDLIKQEVIDYFKLERPEWKNSNIQVYYAGDLIPSV